MDPATGAKETVTKILVKSPDGIDSVKEYNLIIEAASSDTSIYTIREISNVKYAGKPVKDLRYAMTSYGTRL